MKRSTAKKVVKLLAPRASEAERMKAELLITKRQLAQSRLEATNEAKVLIGVITECAAFERELSEKYNVEAPLNIAPDGTLETARS